MSFMAVAVGVVGEGIGATMLAGAMMGGSIGAVSNLAQGKDVFSNLGQNMLTGAAGAGIMSGVGSLAGGATEATQAMGQTAQDTANAAAQQNATKTAFLDNTQFLDKTLAPQANLPALDDYAAFKQSNTIIDTGAGGAGAGGAGITTSPPANPYALSTGASTPAVGYQSNFGVTPSVGVAGQAGGTGLNPATFGGGIQNAAASTTAPASSGILDFATKHPLPTALGASLLYSGLQKPTTFQPTPGPGGNKYDYSYHPAQYDKNGNVIQTASYGTPTVTHYAAEGGAIKHYASGSQVDADAANMYGNSAGKGPYNDKDVIYGADGPMYTDSSKYSGLMAQMHKMSPTLLSRYAKAAKDAAVQAAAQKELYAREVAPADYGNDVTAAAGGGLMGLNTYAAGGMTTPQYNYNAANQTYAQVPQPQTVGNSDSEWLGNFANDAIQGILNNEQKAPPPKYAYDANQQRYTKMAQGGIASLGGDYAAGGKLLQGPGDGMSDSIPAVIQGAKPQRAALAQGEFVVPADVVSHLGNGSTDAGAKRLYAMMDKIRHARTGNKKQGKQINPNNFLLA